MAKEEETSGNKNLVVTFRVFQALFFGMLALGISSVFGDLSTYIQSPVSTFSVTTSVFGLLGAIITGVLADRCKEW